MAGDGLGANFVQMQAAAVITERHRHVIAFLVYADRDTACRRFTRSGTQVGLFNAVGYCVAQDVFKGRRHAIQHAPVHFNAATHNFELHRLGAFFGRLANHAVQALGNAFKLDHAGTQQVTL